MPPESSVGGHITLKRIHDPKIWVFYYGESGRTGDGPDKKITSAIYRPGTKRLRLDSWNSPGFHCTVDLTKIINDECEKRFAVLQKEIEDLKDAVAPEQKKRKE